ncbi:alpha-L-rhamnosidase C-terminal domain-containing protein [Paraglaciecola aquimarina]|uniref:Alpha-L-rhamnosidase C-terminal domain-containing protein n=1 Tax=Paraglaciecola aquimarina TaxID=1235557 RepID=A0ABU3SRD3_9ALTE|nr:alpha-L-rhamnosidase C-terminal domain-containing protein [Paraglaciecola aquimarina]MDU0352564.1 alpha-L-rhamnosidase C-terminal domain-containing protein [Paraglaciecola aquimarina]
MSQAKGGYKTPQGEVLVEWKISQGLLMMSVTIPKNSTADIVLPKVETASLTLNDIKVTKQSLVDLPPGHYVISAAVSL